MKPQTVTPRRMLRSELAIEFLKCLSNYAPRTDTYDEPDLAISLLTDASRERTSDIHLEPQSNGTQVRFRIDGSVYDVATLNPTQAKWLVNQFKAMAELDPIVRFTPKDATARWNSSSAPIDLRLGLAPAKHGEALSIRMLDPKRLERSMRELGLTPDNFRLLESWVEDANGMFLAAGPTGSGKTTTIYALLHELKFSDRVILSVEDPVEYRIDGITQIQVDELHHLDFSAAIKAMLRLDPDYLMLGEIRDAESAHSAVNAAINGRVLLSTVHCRDAVGAITALRNWDLADREIAESLSVVVAQRLVRTLCSHCRERATPDSSDMAWLASFGLPIPAHVWEAKGCQQCRQLGYIGREGIFELWRLDESDYDLILQHTDEHSLRRHLARKGHEDLVRNGLTKVLAGSTTVGDLRRATAGSHGPQATERSHVATHLQEADQRLARA